MFWPIVGLKKKIKRLEAEITSLKEQLKEANYNETHAVNVMNIQHGLIEGLSAKVDELSKTSPNVGVPVVKKAITSYSLGQNIARSLRGKQL